VPYHNEASLSSLAGAGVFGTTHTERGLTFVTVDLSGHSKFLCIFSGSGGGLGMRGADGLRQWCRSMRLARRIGSWSSCWAGLGV